MDWIIAIAALRLFLHLKYPERNAKNSFLVWAANMALVFLLLGAAAHYFGWNLTGLGGGYETDPMGRPR